MHNPAMANKYEFMLIICNLLMLHNTFSINTMQCVKFTKYTTDLLLETGNNVFMNLINSSSTLKSQS